MYADPLFEVTLSTSEIVKKQEDSLVKSPLEWMRIAEDTFTDAMQRMSAAIIQDTDATETALIHNFTKRAEASIKSFKDNARNRLLTYILEKGTSVTEKGTLELPLSNGQVQRAVPTNTKPNDKLTERVLRAKGLSLDMYMDKEVKYCVNERKMAQLIQDEILTDAEYKQCFGEKAYRVGATQASGESEDE